jgi:hypothetical protein
LSLAKEWFQQGKKPLARRAQFLRLKVRVQFLRPKASQCPRPKVSQCLLRKSKMAKGKMPPQFLEYLKKKEAKKEDGTEMDDKEKRKAALDKARKYRDQKRKDKK